MPTNIKLVKGSRRIAKDEPQVPVKIPLPPDHLVDAEIDVFVRTAKLLAGMRVMTEADVDALAMYAVEWCRWTEANEQLRELGYMMRSPNGWPIQNPYLAVANKAQANCLRILTEFGLTPSSRTKVSKS